MIFDDYGAWLKSKNYEAGTVSAQIYRIKRISIYYGDIDKQFDHDQLEFLRDTFIYSTEDERNGRANPTRIPISGILRHNIASYRGAVTRYRLFRLGGRKAALFDEKSTSIAQQKITDPPAIDARTLLELRMDGVLALERVIAGSIYASVEQAVASLTLFSHPQTVHQTGGRGLFPTIRRQTAVGQFATINGRNIMFDDNKSSTDAFLWANGLTRRGRDTQFNHVYAASNDPSAYTALPNICMTPAFLAKVTDTNEKVRALLRYRTFDLYRWVPIGRMTPPKPIDYDDLEWATTLPAVPDVKSTLISAMATKPKNRTVLAAKKLGWAFSD